jgi:hypothetical protein
VANTVGCILSKEETRQFLNQPNAKISLTDDGLFEVMHKTNKNALQSKTSCTYKFATTFNVVDLLPYFDNEA